MLDVARHNADLLRLFCFVLFIFLGLRISRPSDPIRRRKKITTFIVFTIAMHLATGISQRDAWPFSPYPLMRGRWNEKWQYSKVVIVGVDVSAKEWPLDAMTWSPVFPLVLQEWFNTYFPTLSSAERRNDLAFLLQKAEVARERMRAGQRIGNEKFLGPLTASDWWLYERVREASPSRFTALRVYREMWFPEKRATDPRSFRRALIDEYPAHD
jgi:hypothetical protein